MRKINGSKCFRNRPPKMDVKMVDWIKRMVVVEGSNRYLPKSVPFRVIALYAGT